MKYIRTKDGIWLFGGTHAKGKVVIGKKQEIDFGYCFDKKDIIKQADTIEELCDEFVGEKNDYHYKLELIKGKFYTLCNDNQLRQIDISTFNIYGAIWTDEGLNYVAKMKGILPNGEIDWELL